MSVFYCQLSRLSSDCFIRIYRVLYIGIIRGEKLLRYAELSDLLENFCG